MARAVTVGSLARDAGLDLDEALVTVWDAGFETIEDIDTQVPQRLIAPVRVALGLANPKNQMQLSYWEQRWGLDRAALERKLSAEFDITVSPGARVLPKGALRRLNRSEQISSHLIESPLTPQAKTEIPQFGPLVWKPPGHRKDALALTVEEICSVHEALVRDFVRSGDPINPPGVRDDHLLRSAASRPETSLNGIRKYDTIESYAAALLHSLVHNHPFYNGNKAHRPRKHACISRPEWPPAHVHGKRPLQASTSRCSASPRVKIRSRPSRSRGSRDCTMGVRQQSPDPQGRAGTQMERAQANPAESWMQRRLAAAWQSTQDRAPRGGTLAT